MDTSYHVQGKSPDPHAAIVAAILCALFLLIAPAQVSWAQEDGTDDLAETALVEDGALVRLTLQDGSELVGRVLAATDSTVTIRLASGPTIEVQRSTIKQQEALKGNIVEGRYIRRDPNDSQLFILPTARPTGAGDARLTVYNVFLPYVDVGISDYFSASAGTIFLPGAFAEVVYLSPKATVYSSPTRNFAIGSSGALVSSEGYFGFLYGLSTLGTSARAVTVGGGFGFSTVDGFDSNFVLVLGGELQVSNSVKLISENILVPGVEDGALLSGGLRFFGERIAGSFGVGTTPDLIRDGGFPFIPVLSFSYNL